jgi:NTE family protein
MPVLFIVLFFCLNVFAEKAVVLYIGGDYSSVEYHLGVLSEIERLEVPVDTVVGTEWGGFVGALWSAGWSSKQIRELVTSWDSLPRAQEPQKSVLWQKEWFVKHKESGAPFLEKINEKRPYFGQMFFDLRAEEALWRSDIGSKIPFKGIDSANNYPFPPSSPSLRIFSTATALRDTNGTADQRHQQTLWSKDSALIIIRPHSKPNPDSLFETGVHATQSRRSQLSTLSSQFSAPRKYIPHPPPQRFLYHPVFDSVSSEIQGHLESFWNPGDTGILAVQNFLKDLQEDGSYRNVKLVLDTSSHLQINAESNPMLLLSLYGFGGSLFGANVAANMNFRSMNQFGYNVDITAFYGQGAKGIEPNLRFEHFFLRDGDFFVKARIFEYEPTSYFQRRINEDARLMNENGRGITLGIEKPLESKSSHKPVLQVAVEIERREILSGASAEPVYDYNYYNLNEKNEPEQILMGYVYESVALSSMFPFAKWLWQSEGYDRWFSSEGFMAELLGGPKAVSVHSFGQEAPLYVSTQGKLGMAHPLSRYVSISGLTEFGTNFRRANKGKLALPEEIGVRDPFGSIRSDPALENRYRFAIGMGSYMEEWQTPDNSSHRYGLMAAGISLQWQGSGLFFTGGFVQDGEPNPWTELGTRRLFAEPKIRIKTDIFDFVLGRSIVNSSGETKNRFFLSIQGGN